MCGQNGQVARARDGWVMACVARRVDGRQQETTHARLVARVSGGHWPVAERRNQPCSRPTCLPCGQLASASREASTPRLLGHQLLRPSSGRLQPQRTHHNHSPGCRASRWSTGYPRGCTGSASSAGMRRGGPPHARRQPRRRRCKRGRWGGARLACPRAAAGGNAAQSMAALPHPHPPAAPRCSCRRWSGRAWRSGAPRAWTCAAAGARRARAAASQRPAPSCTTASRWRPAWWTVACRRGAHSMGLAAETGARRCSLLGPRGQLLAAHTLAGATAALSGSVPRRARRC
jgi:hypothetical protein